MFDTVIEPVEITAKCAAWRKYDANQKPNLFEIQGNPHDACGRAPCILHEPRYKNARRYHRWGGINQGDNSASGTLTVTARVSNGASRYAMPSPSVSDFVYAALLYKDGGSSETFAKGTAGEDGKFVFSFQRPDEKDGLTLEVFAFKAGTTTFSEGSALLSGKETNLEVKSDKIDVTKAIALFVNEDSEEPGTVSLQIKVPDECLLNIDDEANFNCDQKDGDVYTLEQNGTGIDAKVYKVTFTVKKVDDTDNAKEEIIHIFTESINVLPGMCTDTWSGLAKGAAKEITQDMASTTVYVRGAGGWYETSTYNATATASDDNSGSFLAPLATIQKAVDTIIARNDGTSEYTICIDGTLDGTTAAYLGSYGMADFSALAQDLKLTIKALSGTATLDGGARFDADGNVEDGKNGIENRIIFARPQSGVLNLTLEKLRITGAFISAYGGGIYFNSPGGELKISNGTAIRGNKASRGGGVYILSSTVKMTTKNCTVEGNAATSLGGGIFVDASKLTMEDGTISECTAIQNGGGVYINSSGKFEMSGTAEITNCKTTSTDTDTGGGGIYNKGTLTITGGTISKCTAATSGGGIYNNVSDTSVTTTIANCTITGCKALGNGGGGIYNYGGTLTVGGSILNCKAEQGNGGGIYLDKGSATEVPQSTIEGVEISECKAKYGGGVSVSSGITFRMNDTTISECTASESGGGVRNLSVDAKIKDCVIKLCRAESDSYGGGGIYNYDGTLTVTGGEISENYAKAGGGGIYNLLSSASQACSITLANVKIFKNKTDNDGGGMYNRRFISGTMALMTLNGGTVVSENDAVYGGGVYDRSGGLTLNGATVSQNTATNRGGDVYAEYRGSSLNFSGTTFVGDLYLDRKSDGDSVPRQITVHPDLACASGKTVCATITLPDDQYVPGIKILQAADGGTMEQAVCDKFAVSKDEWKIVINDDGKAGVLQQKSN